MSEIGENHGIDQKTKTNKRNIIDADCCKQIYTWNHNSKKKRR